MTRAQFDAAATLRGANFIGSPQEVAEKILFQHEIFGHQRYLMQSSLGAAPHREVLRSIELLGTEVAPIVRTEVAKRAGAYPG
jgi:alkanesulfonate monooxygenase SsuD/methylene tetrahydromethanopterin reductase-like flavin-dependent oxidoreductase (luciferase family)